MEEHEKFFDGKIIMITGGLGFLGSNAAIRISKLNPKKIILVYSLVPGLGGNINHIIEIKNKSNL